MIKITEPMNGSVSIVKLEKASNEGTYITFLVYPNEEVQNLRIGDTCELIIPKKEV